jgi:hypothetical protein
MRIFGSARARSAARRRRNSIEIFATYSRLRYTDGWATWQTPSASEAQDDQLSDEPVVASTILQPFLSSLFARARDVSKFIRKPRT